MVLVALSSRAGMVAVVMMVAVVSLSTGSMVVMVMVLVMVLARVVPAGAFVVALFLSVGGRRLLDGRAAGGLSLSLH